MDARNEIQPRKKFATYGKTSRKRIPEYENESRNGFSNSSNNQIWEMSDDSVEPPVKTGKPKTATTTLASKLRQGENRSPTKGTSTLPRKLPSREVDSSISYASAGGGNQDTAPVGRKRASPDAGAEKAGVFDLPSSDDELSTPGKQSARAPARRLQGATLQHRSPKRPSDSETPTSSTSNEQTSPGKDGTITPTKRQKQTPERVNRILPVVYDDDALQRHIAMESLIQDGYSDDCVPARHDIASGAKGRNKQDVAIRSRKYQPYPTQAQRQSKVFSASTAPNPTRPAMSASRSPRPDNVPNKTKMKIRARAENAPLDPSPVIENKAIGNLDDQMVDRKAPAADARLPEKAYRHGNTLRSMSRNTHGTNLAQPPKTPPEKGPTSRRARQMVAVEITPSRLELDSLKLSPPEKQSTSVKASAPNMSADPVSRETVLHSKLKSTGNLGRRRRLIDSLADESGNRDVHMPLPEELEATIHNATAPGRPSPSSDSELEKMDRDGDLEMISSSQGIGTDNVSEPLPSSQGAPQQGGPKITYAQQRSYLTESMADEATMFNAPLDVGMGLDGRGGSSGGRRNLRPANKPQEDEELAEDGSTGAIRSIHELRQAGGNKRFLDESEALFEDVEARESSSVSVRRSGLLNLGKKLAKKDYAQQFIDRDLDRRLFYQLEAEKDVIICFSFASIIALLSHHSLGSTSLFHVRQQGVMDLLIRMLGHDQSVIKIAKDRRTNMSKIAQGAVRDLAQCVEQVLPPTDRSIEISPRIVSLFCLKLMTKTAREFGEVKDVPSPTAIRALVGILENAMSWSLDLPPSDEDLLEVDLTLGILEAYTVNAGSVTDASIQSLLSSSAITGLLPLVSQWDADSFKQLQLLTLRLLLNLTNRRSKICRKIGTPEVIHTLVHIIHSGFDVVSDTSDDEKRMNSVDSLILALAALTNLTEGTDSTQSSIWLKGAKDDTLLDGLLSPLVNGLGKSSEANSMEETQSNVAFGYLAVLFSVLCLQPDIRKYTCSRLPGSTIQPLVSAVEEFLQYHQRVDDQLRQEGQGGDAQDGFKERLQANLDILKRSA
ncbi:MAG: hypothetical protein M4579_003302 [Chaenotheca gracillima]|nr:MAG: hypothetical protein M4579_003302 [Chaenotheca gracillima]